MSKRKRAAAKAPTARTGTAGGAKGPARRGASKAASASVTGSGAGGSEAERRSGQPSAGKKAAAKPTPFDPEYERPLSELPPLVFPNSEQYEFRVKADERRRTRLRNETVFAAALGVIGLIVLVIGHTPAFLGLAVIAVVAMAAYEVMVSGLE